MMLGGDVYSSDKQQKGPQKRIAEIRVEIEQLRKSIGLSETLANQREAEAFGRNYDQKSKIDMFKRAQERYKKKSAFSRGFKAIIGKAPKWNEIRKKIQSGELKYDYEIDRAVRGGR